MFDTESTHDYSLHEAAERTRKAGIRLNFDKCIVEAKSCSCFGELYTPQGVKPDPRKVDSNQENASTVN